MGPGPVRTDAAAPAVKQRGSRWRRRRWLLAPLLLGVLLVALHPWLLPLAGNWLDVSTPPCEVDDVLVLGGGADTRPFVAAALYKAGLARRVLLPTVAASPESLDGLMPDEHEVMRQVLLKRGVPADAIVLLPAEVDSTADEARALGRYLDEHPGRRVGVVTNNYHTRRARWIFRTELGERAADMPFFGAPNDHFDGNDWWRSETGCALYTNEFLKMVMLLDPRRRGP
jgi:uncharacterized SAM-binding protein YcdF (DUF218 family)